jgi:hypothetical protein
MKKTSPLILILVLLAFFLNSCTEKKVNDFSQKKIDSLQNLVTQLTADESEVDTHLSTFDTLDFVVFTNQQWGRLHESHAHDVKVNWSDGHFTAGIEKHIEDLKAMFVYAPNTSIKQHPFRFGQDNITCVTGIMTGTFSMPMPIGNGKFIPPTHKSFSIPMCTVGIWSNGVMIEEYLYWDNQAYRNQIGLGKQ